MTAADALIEMTTQCRSAATDDGIEHLAMRHARCDCCRSQKLLPAERTMSATSRVAGSSLHQPPGALYFVGPGYLNGFQRTGNSLQVSA